MNRIGLIVPSSNVVIEDQLQAPPERGWRDRRFHIARLPVVAVEPAANSAAALLDSVMLIFEEPSF